MREQSGWKVGVLLLLSATLGLHDARAAALPDALVLFPRDIQSIEYDNLAELRALPNFQTYRAQYSAPSLQQALDSFSRLQINEAAVDEVAIAADKTGFYGIAFGSFSRLQVSKVAKQQAVRQLLIEKERVWCPSGPICIWFFEDSTAVFGTEDQIRMMMAVRDGSLPSVSQNATIRPLLLNRDSSAAVFGVAPGNQFASWIGSSLPLPSFATSQLSGLLSPIQLFSYSLVFASKIHIQLELVCSSEGEGAKLGQALSTLDYLLRTASNVGLASAPVANTVVKQKGLEVFVNTEVAQPKS